MQNNRKVLLKEFAINGKVGYYTLVDKDSGEKLKSAKSLMVLANYIVDNDLELVDG